MIESVYNRNVQWTVKNEELAGGSNVDIYAKLDSSQLILTSTYLLEEDVAPQNTLTLSRFVSDRTTPFYIYAQAIDSSATKPNSPIDSAYVDPNWGEI
jgi:hypothetical protein